MVATRDELLAALGDSNLLAKDEIDAFCGQLAQQAAIHGPTDLLEALVAAGKLTPLQAEFLRDGKSDQLVIDGYLMVSELGAGGVATVYEVIHQETGERCALKMLHGSGEASPNAATRFRREMESLRQLKHPSIIQYHGYGQVEDSLYLLVEFVDGVDLSRVIEDQGALPVPQAVDLIVQAASGFEHAHQAGYVHRDIKPKNLLMDKQGTLKILDLGLVRAMAFDADDADPLNPFSAMTQKGEFIGTVEFMSPEETSIADHRSDIYSLGCTLYYLLVGLPPYHSRSLLEVAEAHLMAPVPSLREKRAEVPQEVEDAFQKMMAKKIDERPQSMAEVIELLSPFASRANSADNNAGNRWLGAVRKLFAGRQE